MIDEDRRLSEQIVVNDIAPRVFASMRCPPWEQDLDFRGENAEGRPR
jgi:hypothetical protein